MRLQSRILFSLLAALVFSTAAFGGTTTPTSTKTVKRDGKVTESIRTQKRMSRLRHHRGATKVSVRLKRHATDITDGDLAAGEDRVVHRYARSHGHQGRLQHAAWNPILRGSYESQLRQNEEIDRLQLPRIADHTQLQELIRTGELVQIRHTPELRINPSILPENRYCRPWTNQFLKDFSEAYYKEFGVPMQVNSAVRTIEQQQRLRRRNGNAASETGEAASSHLAGITVDLARRGLTSSEHKFMEDYLKELRDLGLIEAAEERRQQCFHVMVSDRYTDWRAQAGSHFTSGQVLEPK